MAYIVPEGGGAAVEVPRGEAGLTIGRSDENTIQIEDAKSSRKHCTVFEENGAFKLRDNDSRNGTLLNGAPAKLADLKPGDVITIGATRFAFRLDAPAAQTAGTAVEAPEAAESAPPREDRWILAYTNDEGKPAVIELGEKATIGRKPGNTIQIKDTKASGVNTEIVKEGPGYTVKDLNSTNGTRVDGKLISEPVGLYHGSVVTVGKTDFIIKNTSIPDLGEAGFESQALGGEDFTAFAKKKRSSLPVGLILLAALAAAGLFAFQKLAKVAVAGGARISSPEGNLLAENFSFEEGGPDGFPAGYTGVVGEKDTVSVVKGGAPTGEYSIEISKGEGSAAAAEAELIYGTPLDASSDCMYEFRAKVRTEGAKGVAGLKITWLKKKDPLYRRVSTSALLSGDSGWTDVSLKALPPENITGMEAAVFFTGSAGSVGCDDLELYKRPAEDLYGTLEGKKLRMTLDNHGVFSARQTGILKDMIWNGQLMLIGREGKSSTFQMFSTLDPGYPKLSEGRVEIRGKIFEFLSQTWIPFKETARLEQNELFIDYAVDPPKGTVDFAGIVFSPDQAKVSEGVGITTADSYSEMTGTFEKGGVTRMLWGRGGGLMSINYTPAVTCLQKREAKELKFLQVVPPREDGSFAISLHFQTEFAQAEMEVMGGFEAARNAVKDGKAGAALAEYNRIATKYPFHREAKRAAAEAFKIEEEASRLRDGMRARFDKAKFFNDLAEVRAIRDEAQLALARYAGCGMAAEFEGLLKEVSLAHEDIKMALGRERVEGLFLRAKDYVEAGDMALARAVLEFIAAEYPGSEWAKLAAEEIGKIGGR